MEENYLMNSIFFLVRNMEWTVCDFVVTLYDFLFEYVRRHPVFSRAHIFYFVRRHC